MFVYVLQIFLEPVEMPLDKFNCCLSENVISYIGKEICESLRFPHDKHEICFNNINKDSIWLRENGSVVLYNTHHMIQLKKREGSLSDLQNIKDYWSPKVSTLPIYL